MDNNQPHILIVEDEKPLAHSLELKLRHEGYQTTIAEDGEQCLALLKVNSYDLVLLDILMPILDGFEVLKQLHNMEQSPRVIVLTNLSQPQDATRMQELGATKIFIKSDTPLLTIIDEIKAAVR